MLRLILNEDHLAGALGEALAACRHRLFLATANLKDLHMPIHSRLKPVPGKAVPKMPRGRTLARSIMDVFHDLSKEGIEVNLLHSSAPSGPFLQQLKKGIPRSLTMRLCPRVHAKAIIADGRLMYLGSANLTGAGLGSKSSRRRNFEAGIWTDDLSLIDPVLDMLHTIWNGSQCEPCGRKDNCPVPLEEPRL